MCRQNLIIATCRPNVSLATTMPLPRWERTRLRWAEVGLGPTHFERCLRPIRLGIQVHPLCALLSSADSAYRSGVFRLQRRLGSFRGSNNISRPGKVPRDPFLTPECRSGRTGRLSFGPVIAPLHPGIIRHLRPATTADRAPYPWKHGKMPVFGLARAS